MLLSLTALAILIAVNCFVLSQNAFQTFRFFDMGSHLDAAWRVYSGQIPHVDFISYTGPIHSYLSAFFFHVLGFNKEALLAHLITANLIVMFAVVWMTWNRVPRWASFLTALVSLSSFYWAYPHPWYTYTAHLFGTIGLACLTRVDGRNHKQSIGVGLLCGVLSVLMLFTKANVFAAYSAVFVWILLWHTDRLRSIPSFFLGFLSAILVLKLTLVPSLAAFWDDVFVSFGSVVAGRVGSPLTNLHNWLLNYYWILIVIVGLPALIARKFDKELHLFLLTWPIAVFCTSTSGAVYQCDTQLTGAMVALGFVVLFRGQKNYFRIGIAMLVLAALLLIGLRTYYSYTLKAWSIPEVGKMIPVTQTIDPRGDYALKAEPFKGWLCNAQQGQVVDEIVTYFNENVPKDDSVMVLTDLFIIYALADRPSFKGIPWVWTPGSNPAPGPQLERTRAYILEHPPTWIITHRGMVAYITGIIKYMGLEEWLPRSYGLVKDYGNYIVLRRK